jgi:hypothetical protein
MPVAGQRVDRNLRLPPIARRKLASAMSTTANIPVVIYLRSFHYEPDAEYVDGEIEERPVGENDHSAWQEAICFWSRQHAREWNVRVRPELRIQVGPPHFKIPDVTVLGS